MEKLLIHEDTDESRSRNNQQQASHTKLVSNGGGANDGMDLMEHIRDDSQLQRDRYFNSLNSRRH